MPRTHPILFLVALLTGSALSAHADPLDGVWSVHPGPGVSTSAVGFTDPVRNRLIVLVQGALWALDLPAGIWQPLSATGIAPAGDALHAVYDPVRDRGLFVSQATSTTRVVALSLGASPTWNLVHEHLASVGAGSRQALQYDALLDRLLMWGGQFVPGPSGARFSPRLYAFPLVTPGPWQLLGQPDYPWWSAAVGFDAARRRLLVQGGEHFDYPHDGNPGGTFYAAQTWAVPVDGAAVSVVHSVAPNVPTRRDARVHVDAPRDRLVIFGGDADVPRWDTWAVDLATGARSLLSASDPGARGALVLPDPTQPRLVAVGGETVDASRVFDLGTSQWSPLVSAPPRREYPAIAYDASRHRMVAFGGVALGVNTMNDLWALSLATMTWAPLEATNVPSPRAGAAIVYDPVADRLVLFGGSHVAMFFDETWELPFATMTWAPLATSGPPPAARSNAAFTYDPVGHRLILAGGEGPSLYADTWQLTLGPTPTWSPLATTSPSPAHANGSVVYMGHEDALLLVLPIGSTWKLRLGPSPGTWTALALPGSPGKGGQAVWDPYRRRAVVQLMNDGRSFELDPGTGAGWHQLHPDGAGPSPWGGFRTLFDPVEISMVVFGPGGTHRLDWSDATTSVAVSLARAEAQGDRVILRWQTSAVIDAIVERSEEAGAWFEVGSVRTDGAGSLAFEDAGVPAGARLEYRLRILDGGRTRYLGHAEVRTPVLDFALRAAGATPSRRPSVLVELPTAGDARLELLDVTGRRLDEVALIGRTAGRHTVELATGRHLTAGVYLARLTFGTMQRTTRLVLAP